MKTLQVRLGDRSYPIWIGKGIRHDDGLWREAIATGKVAIVTNASVGPLYAAPISERLKALGHDVSEISLPDGEQYKDWEHLNRIFDGLMQSRFERNDTLVALGGGVIGDMAGFAAACYQRGMRFVQVPTTLLAQVDSSVGGKTAINHPLGKNMIGAFYQPQAVLMDLDFLKTLPDREFAAGLAEIIKYGCIDDAEFFKWLEDHMDDLRAHSADALSYAIQRSCEIKADIVAKDERESGLRAILNFGHTFGHAIEAGTGYGQWLHGEAVGCGMVMAAELSGQAGGLGAQEIQRIRRLVERAGLPLVPPAWTPSEYLSWMSHDKKTRAGKIRYVVLRALGKADLQAIDDATVARLLEKIIARPA